MYKIENSKVKNTYNGCKWYTEEGDVTITKDIWGNDEVKQNFHMSQQYVKSCYDTQLAQERHDIRVIKEKCEYQLKTFGEVEYLTLLEYKSISRKFGYHNPRLEEAMGL